MSDRWVMVGNKVDSLWREQIPPWLSAALDGADDNNIEIINLPSLNGGRDDNRVGNFPHYHDMVGWRRRFLNEGVRQVHLILPGDKVSGVIIAAGLAGVEVNLHLTEQLHRDFFTGLKCPGIKVKRFFCAADFIARQLISCGIEPNQIRVVEPTIEVAVISRNRLDSIRQSIHPDAAVPLILALEYPDNTRELKPLIWAGALVKHIINPLKMVITGLFTPENRQKVLAWQKELNAPEMLYLDEDEIGWNALSQAADLIAGTGNSLREVGRLLHVKASQVPVLAGSKSGPGQEVLQNSAHVHYVKKITPRQLAAKMLELLDDQR